MSEPENLLDDEDATVIKQVTESPADDTVILQPADSEDDATQILSENLAATADETIVNNPVKNTPPHKPAQIITIGSILQNRFVLNQVLGSGGMGTVFRATDLRRQEAQDQQPDVAIKVLNNEFKNDPELFIALQRETKKSQLLAHPNIVTVYDFDRDGDNVFMVMELLKGKTLSQFLKDEAAGGIPYKKAAHIIKGLSLGLAYAHKKNIIHSDFKPGNIFISNDGDVKILDFGIACAAVNNDSHHDDTVFNARDLGALTPAYASLEMFQGKDPSPADDVYALACVCYELLAGRHPYGKLSAEKAIEVNIEIPAVKGINRKQRNALNRALALKVKQRTATVDEFLNEIESKSAWLKILGILTGISVLGAAAGYYFMVNEFETVNEEIISLSEEQKLAVTDFLELAQIHFEVGYLTAPSGSNALWAYRQVLALDPYNKEAQKGLMNIAELIKQQAQYLYAQGDYNASLTKIEAGLEAVPKDKDLLALKDQILKSKMD